MIDLYRSQGWQRLWVPEYFCYDVIASWKEAGLDILYYEDFPNERRNTKNDDLVADLRQGDAVLRVNYFGMRSYRSLEKLSVVVEDHTHDLIGDWAMNSQADWCIASLRKSLPVPEGGMLWSPVGLKLPPKPKVSEGNERIAAVRWEAMRLKALYLAGEKVEKAAFRAGFVDTEEFFDRAEVCALDGESREFLKHFDVRAWYNKKRENWQLLRDIKKESVRVILPESMGCYPFSLVLLFDSQDESNRVRKELIDRQIYPAVLWNVPSTTQEEVFKFSKGMLSIHCDGRYTEVDIQEMKNIIKSIL